MTVSSHQQPLIQRHNNNNNNNNNNKNSKSDKTNDAADPTRVLTKKGLLLQQQRRNGTGINVAAAAAVPPPQATVAHHWRSVQQQARRRRHRLVVLTLVLLATLIFILVSHSPSSSTNIIVETTSKTTIINSTAEVTLNHRLMKFLTTFFTNRTTGSTSSGAVTRANTVMHSSNNNNHNPATTAMSAVTGNDGTVKSTTSPYMETSPHNSNQQQQQQQQHRRHAVVQAALWSYFAGDAMSAPTHWFYGGFRQVQDYYGPRGITHYTKPSYQLSGSILNKSNLSGAGRATTIPNLFASSSNKQDSQKTIIGHVINHGKQDLWHPSKSVHYHATLQAGENTLECSIARVLMKSIVANQGHFNIDHFRSAYVTFMTTPNSHNDTYASTCHRMYFANWYYNKLDPARCPDNDAHNVDTIDGLVLPTITALAVAGRADGTIEEACDQAASAVAVTRNSPILQQYARAWATLVFQTVRASENNNINYATGGVEEDEVMKVNNKVTKYAMDMARTLRLRTPQIRHDDDEITACYLNTAVPAMLDTLIKYMPQSSSSSSSSTAGTKTNTVWDAILVNANIGGENVHRGSCLGAIWGAAAAGSTNEETTEPQLQTGLYHHDELSQEIHAFVNAVTHNNERNDYCKTQ
jgi:ADP-ribosyl-[dinitrogen reductase] hydrolase